MGTLLGAALLALGVFGYLRLTQVFEPDSPTDGDAGEDSPVQSADIYLFDT